MTKEMRIMQETANKTMFHLQVNTIMGSWRSIVRGHYQFCVDIAIKMFNEQKFDLVIPGGAL